MKFWNAYKLILAGCLVGFLIFFNGCKSIERLFVGETRSDISEEELVDLVLQHDIVYETLYFRRLLVDVDFEGQKRSFRANMYIRKDSGIIVSVTPVLGIEMFRLLFGMENVYLIDRLNREIRFSDYKELSRRFHVDVNYSMLESILTNSLFGYPDNTVKQLKNYYGADSKDYYQLSSASARNISRSNERGIDYILHQLDILPDIYRISKSYVSRTSSDMSMTIEYKSFTKVANRFIFPNEISILGVRERERVLLNLVYSFVEINSGNTISFRLPGNYETLPF